jgi:hypothetical protein
MSGMQSNERKKPKIVRANPNKEPSPPKEREQVIATIRSQRDDFKSKYEESESNHVRYLALYNESQSELKYERQSKAGIESWETQQLKQEIGEMKVLLHESLVKKDEAVNSLYIDSLRSQRDDFQFKFNQEQKSLQETVTQLTYIQQEFQTSQFEIDKWKERTAQNYQLYLGEQQNYQQTLYLYDQEKTKSTELLTKYNEADAKRVQYLTLYNETQVQLKYERRSKAGIKGWETRRKRENQQLKQEIGEMTVLLHESLTRKDEAVDSLYLLAGRMDRIQQLVDSVEVESTNSPVGLIQKLRLIWISIKDILTE